MILSPRSIVIASSALTLSLSATAAIDTPSRAVVKSDGTVSTYRLLPVHLDPSHKTAVAARLQALSAHHPTLPDQHQIAANVTPAVRDQGERGTCAYFATVGVLESYYLAQSPKNKDISLSEECLVDVRNWMSDQGSNYTGSDQPSLRPDPNGDLPNSIILTITKSGVPAATRYSSTLDCTYDGNNTNGGDVALTDYVATVSTDPNASLPYGKGLNFSQNVAPTIDDIKTLLANDIPVEVGIVVYNEYMNGVDWRFDPANDNDSNVAGGHAILLTGYSTANAKTIFTFRNSWGTSWGNSGFGTIDDAILTNSWSVAPSLDFIVSLH
ncbi:MAG: C1 family peptidase [Oligoflexia bacterium]|nr:C1 family peptidase [Oligoflexia bacterium]